MVTAKSRSEPMTRYAGTSRVRAVACALIAFTTSIAAAQPAERHRTYPAPQDAVQALITAVKAGNFDELLAIFGPDGEQLVASSDPATGRRNREVFSVAVTEKWQLV